VGARPDPADPRPDTKAAALLKSIVRGAATTVIVKGGDDPLHAAYMRTIHAGTKPNLAKLLLPP